MLYAYRAVDQQGKPIIASREAGSERELADIVRREGLTLLEAHKEAKRRNASRFPAGLANALRRVTLAERMVFARNLAVMVGAGLAPAKSLEALENQSENPRFRTIIAAIRNEVVKGKTFADSLRPYRDLFGGLFVSVVEAGEISGNLERVLKILARQMKRDHDIRSKVRGAVIYPAIVVFLFIVIGVLTIIYAVPALAQTFRELNTPLPITTQIVISASDLLLHYRWRILISLALAAFAVVWFWKLPRAKLVFSRPVLYLPVFGELVRRLNLARFTRTLFSLVSSGVPIVRSLEVTSSVLGNSSFRKALTESLPSIQRGEALSVALARYPKLFPPMVAEMLKVGEETGTTARMLLRLALFYEEEVFAKTKKISAVVEPAFVLVVGGVAGFFAVAMVQPIYGILLGL